MYQFSAKKMGINMETTGSKALKHGTSIRKGMPHARGPSPGISMKREGRKGGQPVADGTPPPGSTPEGGWGSGGRAVHRPAVARMVAVVGAEGGKQPEE